MATSKLLIAGALLASLLCFFGIGCAPPELEDEEEMGESGSHLLAGTRLTPSQVASQLRAAGFAENSIGKMVCAAKYESSYYSRATNKNKNGSMDRGLFQINSIHLGSMKGCPTSGDKLFDANTNAKCALAIFKSQGINAWYGYRKHKSECDRTKAPAGAAETPPTDADDEPTTTATDEPATIDPDADYDLGAGCWSATTEDTMAPLSCVQQATSRIWFQCKEGKWYRGGDDVQGPYGYCNGTRPLASE